MYLDWGIKSNVYPHQWSMSNDALIPRNTIIVTYLLGQLVLMPFVKLF